MLTNKLLVSLQDNRAMVTLTPAQSERTITPSVRVNISESDKSATQQEQKPTKIRFRRRIQIQHIINSVVIVIGEYCFAV